MLEFPPGVSAPQGVDSKRWLNLMSTATLDNVSANGNSHSLGEKDQTWHTRSLVSHSPPPGRQWTESSFKETTAADELNRVSVQWICSCTGGGVKASCELRHTSSERLESSAVWILTSPAAISAFLKKKVSKLTATNSNQFQCKMWATHANERRLNVIYSCSVENWNEIVPNFS